MAICSFIHSFFSKRSQVDFAAAGKYVMYIDGFASQRPLTYDVENPDDIMAMFDTITYNKVRQIQ